MKKVLPRYRLDQIPREEMVKEVWRSTHPNSRGSRGAHGTIMFEGKLVPVEQLPDDELVSRYVYSLQTALQSRARAQDLDLYELNPDDPGSSILFAGAEILFRTRSGWCLGYVQPAHFDEHELLKARKFAQVVAALHPHDTSRELMSMLRDHTCYTEWKSLERKGLVLRDDEGNVTIMQSAHKQRL